ncbi:MAG TPA: MBL fold metallo-hydrolase [Chitinophagaceae bacterium]|nr:MBL fold metallo-hydrolase [Chitinophagaceae bacterium]
MLTVKGFVFSPIEENTYVLYNESGDCCIIDPGCYYSNERNELKDYILSHRLRPKYLLNTHCHLDHVFGNKFVHDTWDLKPWIHPDEKQVLDFAPIAGMHWNLPFDHYTGDVMYITENDVFRLGEDELKVIPAPGHSPGHVCFYNQQQQFLIGGDVLFRESIGRTDLPGGDFETLIRNIRERLFVLPAEVVVHPGHGPETTIGYEKLHNPFLTGLGV